MTRAKSRFFSILSACAILSAVLVGGCGRKNSFDGAYRVTVDYSRTLPEMIAAGRYDWMDSSITSERFPAKKSGKEEIKLELVRLNKAASTGEVLRYLEERGLRPATLSELLAFGVKFPEGRSKYLIAALGSVWKDDGGNLHATFLYRYHAKRGIFPHWYEYDWDDGWQFLVVRK